jgi:hypothetical protein
MKGDKEGSRYGKAVEEWRDENKMQSLLEEI